MGVYNNNKDGTRSTIANTIQVVDAPTEQFVSRDEFSAVVPNDTSADNKLVNDDKFNTKLNDIWKAQGEFGAKNLLHYPYYQTPSTATGLTVTDNGDGSITFLGASTSTYRLILRRNDLLKAGNYILSNGLAQGVDSGMFIQIRILSSDGIKEVKSIAAIWRNNAKNKIAFTITDEYEELIKNNMLEIVIVVTANVEIDETIYPMIRYGADTDDTWQPYTPTNYQLNQKVDTVAGMYLPNATTPTSKKVVASVGQTSVTFDASTFMSRYNVTSDDLDLDISAKTSNGDIVSYNNVNITGGIVTVTFDALAEQTTFICKCSIIQ